MVVHLYVCELYATRKYCFNLTGIRALLGCVVFGGLAVVLPAEKPVTESERMDWLGSFLGIGGLILFNFVFK